MKTRKFKVERKLWKVIQPFYWKSRETESRYYQLPCLGCPNRSLFVSNSLIKCHQSCSLPLVLLLWPGRRQSCTGGAYRNHVGEESVRRGVQRKRNEDGFTRMEELDLAGGIKTLQASACANAFDGTTCLKVLEGVPVGRGQNQLASSGYKLCTKSLMLQFKALFFYLSWKQNSLLIMWYFWDFHYSSLFSLR